MEQRCSVENCDRKHYGRGLCEPHYRRVRHHGEPQPDVPPLGSAPPKRCAIPDCDHVAEARGWCHGHYLRWIRTRDVKPDVPLDRRTQPEYCTVDGCDRRSNAKGLCWTHRNRLKLTGSVQADVPIRVATGDGSLSHGYRKVSVPPDERSLTPGETYVREHRLVMARQLGRPLEEDEVVHHINDNKLDNDPANLELWSTALPKGQRVDDDVAFAVEMLQRYQPELLRTTWSNSKTTQRGSPDRI